MQQPLIFIGRVSTTKQSQSLETQRQKCIEWSQRTMTPVLFDDRFMAAESGIKEHRKSVELALEWVASGNASGIIVSKLDRLGRSLSELCRIIKTLNESKATLIIIDQSIDTSTSLGKFFFHIMGAVAELERDLIIERITEGQRNSTKLFGVAPYGYRRDPDDKQKLIEHPEEQHIRQLIFARTANGASTYWIADYLNKLGHRSRRNGNWTGCMVAKIIRKERAKKKETEQKVAC